LIGIYKGTTKTVRFWNGTARFQYEMGTDIKRLYHSVLFYTNFFYFVAINSTKNGTIRNGPDLFRYEIVTNFKR